MKLDLIVKDDLDNTELTLVEKILENILDEGQIREWVDFKIWSFLVLLVLEVRECAIQFRIEGWS